MNNKFEDDELVGMTKEMVETPELLQDMQRGLSYAFGLVGEFNFVGEQNIFAAPVQQSPEDAKLTIKLLQEELDELAKGLEEKDKVQQLDAFIDIAYVLFGGVLKSGMMKEFIKGFLAVHVNNMTKFENGKPIFNADRKIIKPESYKAIDLGDDFPYLKNK